MSKSNHIFKSVRESAGLRLAVLFGSFFIFLLLSSMLNQMVEGMPGEARTHLLLSSVVQCLLAFCVPALILARFSSNNPSKWLHLTRLPSFKAIFGVIVVYIISMPAMEWLIDWNSHVHLPESFSSLEAMFRKWEEAGEASTKILLETHGWTSILAGIIVVGVLTGFSEELFFRGGLQGILVRSSIGRMSAIWLAAFIFSTMHFQFFGFLPRLLMGAFFGYLLVWTRSIWVPVFAHVLNNSAVVIASALNGGESTSILNQQDSSVYFDNYYAVIGSVALTALFLFLCRDSIFKSRQFHNSTWQKKQLPPVSER